MEFVIRQNGKPLPVTITSPLKFGKKEDGTVSWTATGKAGALDITVLASMEFDGFMNYQIKVKAAENTSVDDIALLTSMPATTAKYRLGMGYEGSLQPEKRPMEMECGAESGRFLVWRCKRRHAMPVPCRELSPSTKHKLLQNATVEHASILV